MLKKFFFIILVLTTTSTLVKAQRFGGAFSLGSNFSQVDGDRAYGFNRAGLNASASAIIPINTKFSIHLETMYSQKGSYKKPLATDEIDTTDGSVNIKMDYVEVPVFINYYDHKGKMNVGTGLSYGRLVNYKESINSIDIDYKTMNMSRPKTNNLDWFLNLYTPLYKNIKLNFRYTYSITPFRTRTFQDGETRKQYHNMLTFRIMYVFGEKRITEPKSENTNE